MLVAQRLCDNLKCGNAGRYFTVEGETLCSLCSMSKGVTAVRFIDLPRFIELAQIIAARNDGPEAEELRRYLPRRP